MSATAPSGPPLAAVLRRAGAVVSTRDGRGVAAHFGSAAAELAVCVRAVGLVDRSDLSVLSFQAPPAQLSALMTRLAGASVRPGGVVAAAGAWWCGAAAAEIIAVCDPGTASRLVRSRRGDAARHIAVRDRSHELAVIGLLGPHTTRLLAELGAYGPLGDPRQASPFAPGRVDGVAGELPLWWLLASDRRAFALVSRERAGETWQAIERAGRAFGISCVGHEAATRYALIERAQAAPPPHI